MLDPKAVAEAMDVIAEKASAITPIDRAAAVSLGYIVGIARAIYLLCGAEDRPKTGEVSGE